MGETAEALKKIMEQLAALSTLNQAVVTRVEALEAIEAKPALEVKTQQGGSDQGGVISRVQVQSHKEKSLTLTFGDNDCSPNSLRLFIDHFNIAREQNIRKNVDGWDDREFRANELRFQLRGEPALWISQECAMLKPWVKDDEEIVRKLKDRFMGTQSIELNIIAFEELTQLETENLAQYMTRCKQKGFEAFGVLNEPLGAQQRIVWKFLSGIRDSEVRNAVIREKWMKSPTEAKPFEEVLMIAQTAKMNKIATVATGHNGQKGKVAAVSSRIKERRGQNNRTQHSSSESNRSTSSGSARSDGSTPAQGSVNFKCHYCNTTNHYGGWKLCRKRLDENPSWSPGPNTGNTVKGFH